MAQAGIHALVGAAVRKVTPIREWLMLGIILGSLLPDLDNYGVAVATVAKIQAAGHGIHRTFTHSLTAMVIAVILFYIISLALKQPRWANLGFGLGIGIAVHVILDLVIWFNGVELLWPFGGWINLWQGVTPPTWFSKLMDPAEFLFFGLFFWWLASYARSHHTNAGLQKPLVGWTIAMFALLVIFTPLAYLMSKGYQTIYGLFYLVSLTAAFVITIQMRQTVEAA